MTCLLIMSGRSFVRDAIIHFLNTEGGSWEIISLECPAQLAALDDEQHTVVRLVVLYIGDEDAGNESVKCDVETVRRTLGSVPLVLLGNRDDPNQSAVALRTGANGYIPSAVTAEVIRHALPLVAEGGVFAPPYLYGIVNGRVPTLDIQAAQADPGESQPELDCFTQREIEVLKLLGTGLPNKLIAHRMTLKEGTVKVHMRNLMKKLKVHSRTQAALIANRHFSVENHGKEADDLAVITQSHHEGSPDARHTPYLKRKVTETQDH